MQKCNLSNVQLTFWQQLRQQLTKKHQLDIDLEAQFAEVLTRPEFGWDSIAEVTTSSASVSYTSPEKQWQQLTKKHQCNIDMQAHTAEVLIGLRWDFFFFKKDQLCKCKSIHHA